ncbi:unnamed protein product [marine sediment metagenome]|uniref:DUF4352 domain-containing protein n=1 Tax=marine sediment metagenome TaxID=412755 RepID=X1UA54_9ZZZZ
MIGVGPITGQIDKVEVEYGGQVVTEVPEGENFKLAITYRAQNPGVPLYDYWTISMTAMSTDKTIKGYEHAWIVGKSSVGPVIDRIEPLGPMPANDITLRVKLWGNQDYVVKLPIAPPENLW